MSYCPEPLSNCAPIARETQREWKQTGAGIRCRSPVSGYGGCDSLTPASPHMGAGGGEPS